MDSSMSCSLCIASPLTQLTNYNATSSDEKYNRVIINKLKKHTTDLLTKQGKY